jgi:hypothetical protein
MIPCVKLAVIFVLFSAAMGIYIACRAQDTNGSEEGRAVKDQNHPAVGLRASNFALSLGAWGEDLQVPFQPSS